MRVQVYAAVLKHKTWNMKLETWNMKHETWNLKHKNLYLKSTKYTLWTVHELHAVLQQTSLLHMLQKLYRIDSWAFGNRPGYYTSLG